MNIKKINLSLKKIIPKFNYKKYKKKNKKNNNSDVNDNINKFTNEYIELYKSLHKTDIFLNISTFNKKVGIVTMSRTINKNTFNFEFNFKSINNVSEKLKTNENKQECSICYELTDTTLSCNHPICKDCCIKMLKIKNIITYHRPSSEINNDYPNILSCPYCRHNNKINTYKIKKEIKII